MQVNPTNWQIALSNVYKIDEKDIITCIAHYGKYICVATKNKSVIIFDENGIIVNRYESGANILKLSTYN